MKRIFYAFLMMVITVSSYGADTNEICKRKTMMMIVLQKNVDGTVTDVDTDTLKWGVDYGYDIFANTHSESISEITGSTTCNDIAVKSAIDGSSNNAGAAEPGDANTFLHAATNDVGTNCWCKMDGPVTSWWVYLKTYDSASACASGCTSYCANGMANNTEMPNGRKLRHAIFDAIW
ncbi:MAG: hypothetical protein ACLRFK_03455 [Alphaproteobacteria bacterium]